MGAGLSSVTVIGCEHDYLSWPVLCSSADDFLWKSRGSRCAKLSCGCCGHLHAHDGLEPSFDVDSYQGFTSDFVVSSDFFPRFCSAKSFEMDCQPMN